MTKNSRAYHWIFLSVIIVLTLFAYSNVLHGDPQFDDEHYLFEDHLLRSPYAFKDLNLWNAFKAGVRPVTAFTFSLNYYFGGRDTFSYHLTNLLIHIVNGALVYLFIYMTLTINTQSGEHKAQNAKSDNSMSHVLCAPPQAFWIAFLTSLLFSIHPIQTESVSYIYQRSESLSSLFYLASLISFIVASKTDGRGRVLLYLFFIATFVIALGSKEVAVTLPAVALLYGIFFFERREIWKKLAAPCFLLFAGLSIAAVRLMLLAKNPSAGYELSRFNAWEYLLTQLRAIITYIRLLLLPVGQNIDHDYPIIRSFWEAQTIIAACFLISLLFMAALLYKRWRPGSFFILWFLVTLSPSSSILPLKDVFVEHRLYLPSIGLYFIFSSGIIVLSEKSKGKKLKKNLFYLLTFVCIVMAALLWNATFNRNYLWSSRLSMWKDAIRKSPKNARAWNNLANCYLLRGDYRNTVRAGIRSITLNPGNMEPYFVIGYSFERLGLPDIARDFFVVFVRYAGDKFPADAARLSLKYNIKNDEAISDYALKLLKQRAMDALKNIGAETVIN